MLCLLVLFSTDLELNAQQVYPSFSQFTFEDGLTSQNVNHCVQDHQGYMWFATDAGVCRYNGTDFERFSIADGLCDDAITRIAIDPLGPVWFLTENNCLSYYYNGEIITDAQFHELANQNDNMSTEWFWHNTAGRRCFFGRGTLTMELDTSFSLSIAEKYSVSQSSRHILKDTIYSFPTTPSPSTEFISNFIEETAGNSWCEDSLPRFKSLEHTAGLGHICLTNQGVKLFDNSWQEIDHLLSLDMFLDCKDADAAFADRAGNIWITSITSGVYFYRKLNDRMAAGARVFAQTKINHVFEDVDGNVWYCTQGRGVLMVPASQREITWYRATNDEQALCLNQDNQNRVLVGTSNGTLCIFNGRNLTTQFNIIQQRGSNGIGDLLVDERNLNLWCAGDFGLLEFQNLGPIWHPEPTVHTTNSVRWIENGIQEKLIAATLDSRTNLSDLKFIDPRFSAAFVDDSGKLWKAIDNTLSRWNPVNGEVVNFQIGGLGTKISALSQAEDGTLLICTHGSGLIFFQNESEIGRLNMSTGLPSNTCKKVFTDGNTHFLATDRGVVIYEWNGVPKITSTYTEKNGLLSTDIHDVLVNDKFVYLATSQGLVIFDKNQTQRTSSPPPVYWKYLNVGDEKLDLGGEIDLSYDQSYFDLGFTALCFDPADQVQFEYRLAQDKPWNRTLNSSLQFPSFSPGDYELSVRAKKHNSEWSTPISLSFAVAPPYYSSWWFRILVGLVIAAFGYAVVRFFLKRKYERELAIIKQEQALAEERNRISADMHDDLGSELTNIVILSRIAQADNEQSYESIQKIDNAASGVITKMNEIIWALNPAHDTLKSLASYIQSYANNFLELHDLSGRVLMPDTLPEKELKSAFRRNYFLIVKESLQNINKHAEADRVDINAYLSQGVMYLTLEDNGNGFDFEKLGRGGNGLKNMKRRAQNIGGKVVFSSSPNKGSILVIRVRLSKDHAFV